MATCGCPSFVDTPVLEAFCPPSFALFMGALQLLLQSTCDIADPCGRAGVDAATLLGDDPTAAYDFIVVGAGAAGPVVSSRLSENPNWQVLLLEAGPEEPTAPQVPAFAVSGKGSAIDWQFTTAPQSNACLGSSGGVCSWPRGKMVGGTTAFNGMKYMRAHASVYDGWAAPGWGYRDVLPYFIKAEHNLNAEALDDGYHGVRGPLVVQNFPDRPTFTEALLDAAEHVGYSRGDLAGRNQTGIGVMQGFAYGGLRGAPSRMYLRAATANRDNLRTAINAHVTRVLIHPENLTAYGVEYVNSRGQVRTVLARKEVILSAGAVGTPHILLLSGIGPKEDLQDVPVPVVLDLPGVGRNLQNHVSTAVRFTIDEQSKQRLTNDSIEEFLQHRTGPMASAGVTTTGMFLSRYATNGIPDIQVFFVGYSVGCFRTGSPDECSSGEVETRFITALVTNVLPDSRGYHAAPQRTHRVISPLLQVFFVGYSAGCSRTGSPDECSSGEVGPDCGPRSITALVTNVLPESRGYLRLQSADPFQQPFIQPNYLSATRDEQVVLDGIRTVLNMVASPALQAWGAQVVSSPPTAGCEDLPWGSDEYWVCALRYDTNPENHQAGTCKMGPSEDGTAVVDAELRVHGVSGLRVVDASVFPLNPNANPVATIVMAAEKLADMVKEAWPEDYEPNPVPVVPD